MAGNAPPGDVEEQGGAGVPRCGGGGDGCVGGLEGRAGRALDRGAHR